MKEKYKSNTIQETRLYELLYLLKPKQRSLSLAIIELIYPKNRKQITILRSIIKHINNPKKTAPTKISLMQVSGVKKATTFNHISSNLFLLISKMLYLLELIPQDTPPTASLLMTFFIEQQLPINTQYAINNLNKILKKEKYKDNDFYFYKMKYYDYHIEINKDDRIATDENFLKADKYLDLFYITRKLRLLCEERNRNRIVQKSTSFLKNSDTKTLLFKLVIDNNYFDSVVIKSYVLIYQMLDSDREENYAKAKQYLMSYYDIMDSDLEAAFINYLMNQCIRFINKHINRIKYAREYINQVDLFEKKGFLFIDGQLSPSKFEGIVLASLIAQDIDWTINFIDRVGKLNSINETFIKATFEAHIKFHNNDIEGAHNLISKVDTTQIADPFYIIFHNKLLAQIFFAKKELLLAESSLKSFRVYINRKHKKAIIASDKILSLREFVNFTLKVITLRLDPDTPQSKFNDLKNKLSKNKGNVAYSEWIEQIINNELE